jgi:hypothetical protein
VEAKDKAKIINNRFAGFCIDVCGTLLWERIWKENHSVGQWPIAPAYRNISPITSLPYHCQLSPSFSPSGMEYSTAANTRAVNY